MEISVADQRILLFTDQISPDDAKNKAWEKKTSSFGAISKLSNFLTGSNDQDFELIYQEHRLEPFWHVSANARYVYDRKSTYPVEIKSPVVTSITLHDTKYDVENHKIQIPVMEHCIQTEQEEVFVDGITGRSQPELKQYLALSPHELKGDLTSTIPNTSILVPPQTRVSAIMRDAIAKMIKGIQADSITEETVQVSCVDLYYRPVYAFQYRWKSKNKEAIVEVNALTGEIGTGNRTFNEYVGKVLDKNFLFDVGADAAGVLIPGGSIAVKIAKKYIDTRKK